MSGGSKDKLILDGLFGQITIASYFLLLSIISVRSHLGAVETTCCIN